jgi:hypothetical protein
MSQYVKKLEDYEDLEVSIIRTTKINKVLKALIKLNTIPRDEEFKFRQRSMELLAKWSKILGSEPQDDSKADDEKETGKSTPATNGVHEDMQTDKKDDKPEAPAAATEPEPEPAPANSELKEEPKPAGPELAPVAAAEEKPSEAAAPETAPVEEPKPETAVAAAAEPVTIDKAPESAAGAAEATEAVKASE